MAELFRKEKKSESQKPEEPSSINTHKETSQIKVSLEEISVNNAHAYESILNFPMYMRT